MLVSHDRALVVTHEDASKQFTLRAYGLTSIGQQICELGSFKSHEIYLRSVGQAIVDKALMSALRVGNQLLKQRDATTDRKIFVPKPLRVLAE